VCVCVRARARASERAACAGVFALFLERDSLAVKVSRGTSGFRGSGEARTWKPQLGCVLVVINEQSRGALGSNSLGRAWNCANRR